MKFYKFLNDNKDKYIDIYCDMDGVIAEYDIGNFDYKIIRPITYTISILEELNKKDNIDIYILSVCKNNDIVKGKEVWLNKYMSFLKKDNIILISKEKNNLSSKDLKYEYLKKHKNKDKINILIDDDNEIIKYIINNIDDIKIFHISSLIK